MTRLSGVRRDICVLVFFSSSIFFFLHIGLWAILETFKIVDSVLKRIYWFVDFPAWACIVCRVDAEVAKRSNICSLSNMVDEKVCSRFNMGSHLNAMQREVAKRSNTMLDENV